MKLIRFLVRFTFSLLAAIVLLCLLAWLSGNSHIIKAVRSTYLVGKTGPTIDDYHKFENRIVESAAKSQPWPRSTTSQTLKLDENDKKIFASWESTAYLLIQADTIRYEKYWDGYESNSLTNSFSMAKSFTALAIGAAIEDGFIKSLDQKVGDFLEEFKSGEKSKITIRHLLEMTSGIDFGESYGDPFGYMAKTYYGNDLYDLTVQKPTKDPAGERWKYQGGNTLLLSFILEKATQKSLSEYFSEKFWKPLGTNQDAIWTLNQEDGIEKAYCCFYSNARDFAKVGQMMLDSGEWNGTPLISRSFFLESTKAVNKPDENGKKINYYGLQWWLTYYDGGPVYYARGIQGQYIVAIPKWDAVFVRLGHKRDPKKGVAIPDDFIQYLTISYKLLKDSNLI